MQSRGVGLRIDRRGRWGEDSFFDQGLPVDHPVPKIDFQDFHSDPADWRSADKSRSSPEKMFTPPISTRMVQPHHIPARRIDSSNARPLVVIAMEARECEIVEPCGSAVFFGDHMINLVADIREFLWHQAIFTASAGTDNHLIAN